MSLFHRPSPSLLLHSGLALLCIYRCTCMYITILWGGRCSDMQGQCFMLFSDLEACFHPWEKWVIVQMSLGSETPRTYAFIWKQLAEWSVAYSNDFECHRWFPFEKNGVLEVVMVKGLYFERVSKNTRVKLHRNHWYQCIGVCHRGDVFVSAIIQELISKTCAGRERKCKHPGLGSQLVIVSTLLENSSGLPNALLFAGCLIIYSTNKGAEKS